MGLSTSESLWAALVIALALAVTHLLAGRMRRLSSLSDEAISSLAGGIAVAYVFLHLLPELAEGNEAIGEALGDVVAPTPLLDLAIFLIALAGFTLFYGLERLARRSAGESAENEPSSGVFRLHLGSFLLYNALITYTMPLRLRTGVPFAVLFTIAMGLHFVLTDRGLAANYPLRFRSWGRYALAGGLIGGWVAVALAAPANTVLVSALTAALGGSVLLNVFKEELPSDRGSSFAWFLSGLVGYAALLALTTAFSE